MKRANSKLAALTLITTLAVTSVIGTTVHADVQEKVDQAVSRGFKPIDDESLRKSLGNSNPQNYTIRAKLPENTNLKSQGISITGKVEIPSKSSENSSWFWKLWNRFTTFVKNIFS
ncbi:hypothetical protein HO520_03705 [Streptococcus suis]|nr:hypothetical protein [Streptococcus suis]